jgi:hypothetical protein
MIMSEATIPGTTTSSGPPSGSTAPHPGFGALAAFHLRNLLRVHRGPWLLLAAVVIGVPLFILLLDLGPDLFESRAGQAWVIRATMALWFLQGATLVTWLLWPMVTWRTLPPGGRHAMDALPVERRTHRLARVAAGLVLPVVLMVAVWGAHLLLRARLSPFLADVGMAVRRPENPVEIVLYWPLSPGVTLLALLAAYLVGSVLALWRVPVSWSAFGVLLVFVLLPAGMLTALGRRDVATTYLDLVLEGTWSPARVALLGFRAEPADLLPIVAWLLPLGALTWHLAGAHDRR